MGKKFYSKKSKIKLEMERFLSTKNRGFTEGSFAGVVQILES